MFNKEYTEKLAKELAEKVKANFAVTKDISEENWTFKVIASTEAEDRHGEKVMSDWRMLENFMKKNPVVLFWHDYRSISSIMWKATKAYVEDKQLIIEWIFAWTEHAQVARQLYDEGVLKTVSVWFIAHEKDWNKITKAELLELSFVPIPANQDALSLDWKVYKKAIELWIVESEMKELSQEDSIEYQLKELASALMNKTEDQYLYVVDIFTNEFVFNIYWKGLDKYYRLLYSMNEAWNIEVDENAIEVESQRSRVDKMKMLKANQSEAEILEWIKALTEKVDTLQKNIESMETPSSSKSDTDEESSQKKAEQELKRIAWIAWKVLHEMKSNQ